MTEAHRQKLREVLARPRGRRIGVFGLGVSGRAMALFLARRGAEVLAVDQNTRLDAGLLAPLHQAGVMLSLGDVRLPEIEALALSPGIDPRQTKVAAVLQAGVPIFGELELAGRLPSRVVGITGTNGKSTTTALVGALAASLDQRVFVGGNFGEPLVTFLDSGKAADLLVLELSSFQLETAYSFAPDAAVVLNVTPDHMDRYASFGDYVAAKAHLVRCVPPHGCVVLSADDAQVRAMAPLARGRVLWFSTQADALPGPGAYAVGETLVSHRLADFGTVSLHHARLLGRHNRENALAAFLALHGLGLCPQAADLMPGYAVFTGLPHRLEPVGDIEGVTYLNDSKATNDASAATALRAMDRPVVLLAGGKDKGSGYANLVAAAQTVRMRAVVTFGAAGDLIAAAFAGASFAVQRSTSLEAACLAARALAKRGDVVLLSPACSSFDAFTDYTQRGSAFKAWVQRGGNP